MNVVLLHALPLDERMWDPQRPALAEHLVLTPNLYRLGSSVDGWADRVRAIALDQDAEGLANAVRAIRDRPDSRDVVAALPCPLLVAVGSADPVLPLEVAREAAKLAPEGRLEVFEGAGHVPSFEQPDRFNELLRDFLQPLA